MTDATARTLADLAGAPSDRPVALILRHAERPPIPPGVQGDEVGLTIAGRQAAGALGRRFGDRLVAVRSSPVGRCMDTGAELVRGAGTGGRVRPDRLLGDPGVLVHEPSLAGRVFASRPYEAVLRALLRGEGLPGFAPVDEAADRLMEGALPTGDRPGVHVCVTHDSILGVCLGVLFGRADLEGWPGFLEGAVAWRDGARVRVAWQGEVRRL